MQHLDEGTIHSWLDGALTAEEGARVELHVAVCEACSEAVAEARGLIAASSRILTALDDVPRVQGARGARGAQGARGAWLVRARIAAVVTLVVAGGALAVAVRRGASPVSEVQLASERVSDLELAAADSPVEPAPPAPQEVPVALPMRDGRAVGGIGGAASPSAARERDLARTRPADSAPTAMPTEGYAVAAAPPAAPPVRTNDTVQSLPIVMAERAERQQEEAAGARSSVTGKLADALAPRRAGADASARRFAEPGSPETRLNAPASVEVVAPVPLTEERALETGRVVLRRIYRIEGMLVTLDERQPLAREEVAQERVRRLDEAVAAVASPPDSTPRLVNSVRWVDARGAEFTLSGSATQPQLERIRKLLGY